MSILTLSSISKTYGKKVVLIDISFSIKEAEVFCLLGVNGAGKTTLSSIISTLQPPTTGDVLFRGTSIYQDIPAYRMQIGFCPQHANLHSQLTVFQNLYFSARAYRFSHQEAEARAHEMIAKFRLEKYKNDFPTILSGGYKQQVLIARTLIHNPQLIIFDEPTVGLDPHKRQNSWKTIEMLRSEGKSILLTTHYMDEVERLADRVCVLDKGVIKLIDTTANLKSNFAKSTLESVFIELTAQEEEEEQEL